MTAKQAILERLHQSDKPLALFQFNIPGVLQTALSARLRDLRREGAVVGRIRPGTPYKEWSLVPSQPELIS